MGGREIPPLSPSFRHTVEGIARTRPLIIAIYIFRHLPGSSLSSDTYMPSVSFSNRDLVKVHGYAARHTDLWPGGSISTVNQEGVLHVQVVCL